MHLPPGDKTFSQKKKRDKPYRFLNPRYLFLHQTRADALVVRVEHWTPEGDCTERGDKERYRNESDQKRETSL